MPFHPVLEAFGGNLKIVGTGASTANQHMPHFADDIDAIQKIEIGWNWIRTNIINYPSYSLACYRKPLVKRCSAADGAVTPTPGGDNLVAGGDRNGGDD